LYNIIYPSDINDGRGAAELAAVRKEAKILRSLFVTHLCPLLSNHWAQSIDRVRIFSLRLAAVFLSFLVSRLRKTTFSNAFSSALNNLMPWLLEAHLRISVGTRLSNSRMVFILWIVSKTLGNEVPQGKKIIIIVIIK